MQQYKSGKDYLKFVQNHFLSSDEGRALMKSVFTNDPDTHDILMQQLDTHNAIMEKIQKSRMEQAQAQASQAPQVNPQLALGDETPLVPRPQQAPLQAPAQQSVPPQRLIEDSMIPNDIRKA